MIYIIVGLIGVLGSILLFYLIGLIPNLFTGEIIHYSNVLDIVTRGIFTVSWLIPLTFIGVLLYFLGKVIVNSI